MMDYDKMSKEELISELRELNKAYEGLKQYYERDIVYLNNAEKQIVKSEEKFRKAFLTSPDSVNINRLEDGLYVSINEGFTKMLGYTEEEILGKSSLEMNIWVVPEERSKLVAELKEKGRIENFETNFRHKNGSVIYGLMSASVMEIEGVLHLLSVTKDISERRSIEESLAREQFLVNSIMDNVTDHIYFKDKESRFIRVNRAHARRFGLNNPSEIIGKTDFDFFSLEHAQQAFDDEQEIIRTGTPINIEEKETNPNAPDTWVSTIKMPLRDVNNRIVGTFGISRDISKRKKAEYDLEAERNLLRALIDNMPDRIYAKDTDSRFIICNNALVKRMGKSSQEEIIGKSDLDLLPGNLSKNYYENEQEIIRTGKPLIDHEEAMGTVSGKTRWNLTSKVPFRDPNGKILGIVGIGKDITDRKIAEEEIRLKNEMLILINAEKDKFFSIIAHDLRGPLSAFVEATKILAEDIQSMTLEEVKNIISSMKTDASNIYLLLENLLEWSRLQRGVMEFKPEKFDIRNTLLRAIDTAAPSARKKSIKINIELNGAIEVRADSHMLETIVRNLVSNAVKFTQSGGEVSVSAHKGKDGSVIFRVSDTGIGMSGEILDKLFRLTDKTNRLGTEGEPSSGLGLLLVKDFVEKNSGKIFVESEPGKGSVFTCSFPAV